MLSTHAGHAGSHAMLPSLAHAMQQHAGHEEEEFMRHVVPPSSSIRCHAMLMDDRLLLHLPHHMQGKQKGCLPCISNSFLQRDGHMLEKEETVSRAIRSCTFLPGNRWLSATPMPFPSPLRLGVVL